jgi:2-amino-4-hydroxy-6-hydroxymethyldihydropteridine diphosphokinase
MKETVYLLLGSNLNNPLQQLAEARKQIERSIGSICSSSSVYQTAPWGKTDQPDFFNQVLKITSALEPVAAMEKILTIETRMGRLRSEKNAARTIDIDILFWGKQVIRHPKLTVPHPRIAERRFVLTPLNELSPAWKDPVSGLSMHQWLLSCKDPLNVKKNSAAH